MLDRGEVGSPRCADPVAGRTQCYRCHRPAALCLCAIVPVVHNRTGVHVLQHPRERFHPLGTARFVEMGLSRASLEVAYGERARSVAHQMPLPPGTALLYPAPDAPFLEDLAPEEQPRDLLVIDGTWTQARALYRQNPWLHELPHRQIRPLRPSRYRVRKEPKAHFVSTLEAIAYALSVVEPDTDLAPLIDAFERLMDDHLAQQTGARAVRTRRPRQKLPKAVPPLLVESPERAAVVYMEPSLAGAHPGARLPVQLCALRLSDGARFEIFARAHASAPGACHLGHMGLAADHFEAAPDVAEAVAAMDAFLGDCVTVGWNRTPADLLQAGGGRVREHIALKAAYCNLRKRHAGSLEALLIAEGLAARALPFEGRAARRMGNAQALLTLLQREGAGRGTMPACQPPNPSTASAPCVKPPVA